MRYIRILELKAKGFMSLGEVDINFVDQGLVRVLGENEQESFDSNGSGKSAIFESLLWALRGETVRGQKKDDIINRYWEGYAEVEVKFEYNGSVYRIIRRRNHPKHNNDVSFEIDGEDESGSTMTKTNQIIDDTFDFLSSDLIESIMILGQGLPNKFSGLTPSARKNRLEDISDSAKVIDNLKDQLKSYIDEKSTKRDDLIASKSSQKALLDSAEGKIADIEDKIKEIRDSDNFLSEKEVEKIKDDIRKYKEKRQQISDNSDSLRDKKSKIDTKKSSINSNVRSLKSEISKQKKILDDLKGKDGEAKCHFCGEILSGKVEKVKRLKDEVKEKIRSFKSDLKEEMEKAKVLEGKSEVLEGKLVDIKKKLNVLREKQQKLEEKLDKRPKFDVSVSYLEEEKEKYEDEIKEITKEHERYDNELNEIEEVISAAKHMKRMVSREFRGYLLRGVVSYINHKLKEYSNILYKEENQVVEVELDGNDLHIFFDGRIYESLSGGEKRRLDVAIQFALRDLSMNEAGVGFNVLVLDEVFDSVDETGINSQLDLISKKNEDLESIYQISHRSDLFIPADKELKVVKNEDGVSYISEYS